VEVEMKRVICLTVGAVLVFAASIVAADPPHGKGNKHAQQRAKKDKGNERDAGVAVHVAFVSGDVTILRNHYSPRYRNLPPGLQKKIARGGHLPPGWQKKFEPFPVAIERRLPPLPIGYRRGLFDGHAVIYDSRTNLIVDVAVMF
jgi:hypothetical protein